MEQSVSRKIKDGIISFVISAFGVGILVGNAYMLEIIGYPNKLLDLIGFLVMLGSLIFAVLPLILLWILSVLGLEIQLLQGRGASFIEIWIYCMIFYSILIYFFLQYRRRRREKRILAVKKDSNRFSEKS